MTVAWQLLREFSFTEAGMRIELRVIDVQVDGESGEVYTDWFIDGIPIKEHTEKAFEGTGVTYSGEPVKQEWVFVDGRWEERSESNWVPSDGCSIIP